MKSYQKTCVVCGVGFVASDVRGKLCSDLCRAERLRQQRRDYYHRNIDRFRAKPARHLSPAQKERKREYSKMYQRKRMFREENKESKRKWTREYQKLPHVKERRAAWQRRNKALQVAALRVVRELMKDTGDTHANI